MRNETTTRIAARRPAAIVRAGMGALCVYALFSTAYLTLQFTGGNRLLNIAAVLAFGAVCCGLAWLLSRVPDLRWWPTTLLDDTGDRRLLVAVIVIGVALRIAFYLMLTPQLIVDHALYFSLGEQLATSGSYEIPGGQLAFYPPGLPLVLAAHFLIFGAQPWVPLLLNCYLFVLQVYCALRLAELTGHPKAGRFAAALLTVWPNSVLASLLPGKELLFATLIAGTLIFFLLSWESTRSGRRVGLALLAGVCAGLGALTQASSTLLLPFIGGYLLVTGHRRFVLPIALALIAAAATVAPWTVRNYHVLGAFVPVSTNGGVVFYRSNNELATPTYSPRGYRDTTGISELEQNRLGYQWGFEWIRSHPVDFVKLMMLKQVYFLGPDDYGAFFAVEKGTDLPSWATTIARVASQLFWAALWIMILAVVLRTQIFASTPTVVALVLPLLYFFLMHSVFESGDRQHMSVIVPLAILAACYWEALRNRSTPQAARTNPPREDASTLPPYASIS